MIWSFQEKRRNSLGNNATNSVETPLASFPIKIALFSSSLVAIKLLCVAIKICLSLALAILFINFLVLAWLR